MELVNPNTGTIVRADGAVADRLISVGFKPVVVEVVPVRRSPGRPKKK